MKRSNFAVDFCMVAIVVSVATGCLIGDFTYKGEETSNVVIEVTKPEMEGLGGAVEPATEPIVSEPTATEPIVSEPTATEPIVVEPTIEFVEEEVTPELLKETLLTLVREEYQKEATYLAKTLWGEARGCPVPEQEKVVWCILNRVDDSRFPDTIIDVIVAPNQFYGYSYDHPVDKDLYELSMDVIYRWRLEKDGLDSSRNLEKGYVYFQGDGVTNHFKTDW